MRDILFWLNDQQWNEIQKHLPVNENGPRQLGDRAVVSGIIHVLRTRCRWLMCPTEYGSPMTILSRYHRWVRQGIWAQIEDALDDNSTVERSIYTLSYRSLIGSAVMNQRDEIDNILRAARRRNADGGITGALIFDQNRFVQVLEGRERSVKDIFASVERDKRHTDVTILAIETGPSRRFDGRTMALVGTSPGARAYYRKRAEAFQWSSLNNEALCSLMVRMIALDEQLAPST